MARLFIRGNHRRNGRSFRRLGEKFTDIKAASSRSAPAPICGRVKSSATKAAAIASRETGCPITTHTTQGGGLEQAQVLLQHGAKPERIIIGHQGFRDDREHDEAHEYHTLIYRLARIIHACRNKDASESV